MMLDEQVGKIIKTLKGRNDIDKTDIVITSDHGEMLGDYSMLYKSTFLEPSIRTPMIICKLNSVDGISESINAPISSTEIFKDAMTNIQKGKEALYKVCERKYKGKRQVIVEYRNERCFIKGRKKLVVDRESNILWSSIIRKDSIHEDNVDVKDLENDNKLWESLIEWSKRTNAKMNSNQNALKKFIACE